MRTALRLLLCLLAFSAAAKVRAAVAVISNRTVGDVRFTVTTETNGRPAQPVSYSVESGEVSVVQLNRGTTASLIFDGGNYAIQPDAAYYFGAKPGGKAELGRIGLGEMPAVQNAPVQRASPPREVRPTPPVSPRQAAQPGAPDQTIVPMGSSQTAGKTAVPNGTTANRPIGTTPLINSTANLPGGNAATSPTPNPPPTRPFRLESSANPATTITVKILVDEEEANRRPIWERRLRLRIQEASEILERHCGMRLKVVAVDTWQSDNEENDFTKAVADFTTKVDPSPARIAIGFTSQYQITRGRTHLGGTRGPLSRHILLREWSQFVAEPERLELLVHELGHFLGAVHSVEPDSVMRQILGDKQARAKKFQIHFDPLNTLAMNLVAEEWRQHPPLHSFGDIPPTTRERLRAVYQTIDQSFAGQDPAAAQYLRVLGVSPLPPMRAN